MQVEIRSRSAELDAVQTEWVRRRLDFALARFGSRIRKVAVTFEDLNGPRGGVDQKCRIDLQLSSGERLLAEVVHEDVEPAAAMAFERIARRVRDELAKRREVRRGPSADGQSRGKLTT